MELIKMANSSAEKVYKSARHKTYCSFTSWNWNKFYVVIYFKHRTLVMMNKIKLFLVAQNYFEAMGFYASPSQPNQICSLNRKNLYYILVPAIIGISIVAFMSSKAQSVYEYGISFFIIITIMTLIAYYMVILFKMGKLLNLVGQYEEFIEKRKWFGIVLGY